MLYAEKQVSNFHLMRSAVVNCRNTDLEITVFTNVDLCLQPLQMQVLQLEMLCQYGWYSSSSSICSL